MTTNTAGRNPRDVLFERATALCALAVLSLALLLLALLVRESLPAIRKFGAAFLVRGNWDPVAGEFGALPFIYGTLATSLIALLIAVPLSVGGAVFISEFAPPRFRKPVAFLSELLAAIPSVIYGLWGIFVLVPVLRDHLMKPVARHLGWIPLFRGPVYGPGILAASVILAIMIVPFILSVSREVMATVPQRQKEAVLAMGGTRWEMIRIILGQHCVPGIFGAAILGLGRAVGETMAVTMLIGNRPETSLSIFQPGHSMAAVIANEFTEATDALYLSALVEIGLVLFAITFVVNLAAKSILARMTARTSGRRA